MSTMQERGQAILDNIQSIRKLRQEQEKLLKELEQIAIFMTLGIDPSQIAQITYDPKVDHRRGYMGDNDVYNKVLMKDGTVHSLETPLAVRPKA